MKNFQIDLHYLATRTGLKDMEKDDQYLKILGYKTCVRKNGGASPQFINHTIVERHTHVLVVKDKVSDNGFSFPNGVLSKLRHIDDEATWSK